MRKIFYYNKALELLKPDNESIFSLLESKADSYYQKVNKPEVTINKDYYEYAQQQITKLREELFFEGKL